MKRLMIEDLVIALVVGGAVAFKDNRQSLETASATAAGISDWRQGLARLERRLKDLQALQ